MTACGVPNPRRMKMYTFDELAGLFRKIQIASAPFLYGEVDESARKLLSAVVCEFEDMLNKMMFNQLDERRERRSRVDDPSYRPSVPPEEEQKVLDVAADNGRA
jgi:hypothetical protein